MTHKSSNVAAATNFFSSMYGIGMTCFDEYFLFSDDWKALFFIKIYRYSEGFSNPHVITFFERNVLKEVNILWLLHNNSTMLLPKFKFLLSKFPQLVLFFDYVL